MKKLILGMALFAGSFALANQPVNSNNAKTAEVTCSCELAPQGTCTITVYYSSGATQTYTYHGVTEAWCNWKALEMRFAPMV